jgi:hypothetical protein
MHQTFKAPYFFVRATRKQNFKCFMREICKLLVRHITQKKSSNITEYLAPDQIRGFPSHFGERTQARIGKILVCETSLFGNFYRQKYKFWEF